MEGIRNEGRAIIYIDEIHNLIGAGRTGDGSMDASNMLKPYLESGDIRFIGSTTYEEYNRYFARSKGLVRRFQQIDILEPSIEETIHIVEGLKEKYEEFHGVTYQPDVIPYAVKASARYISDRFLPDKAIDLVDEAGSLPRNSPYTFRRANCRQDIDNRCTRPYLQSRCARHERRRYHLTGKFACTYQCQNLRPGRGGPAK